MQETLIPQLIDSVVLNAWPSSFAKVTRQPPSGESSLPTSAAARTLLPLTYSVALLPPPPVG